MDDVHLQLVRRSRLAVPTPGIGCDMSADETPRDRAVREVDARHGYTIEFSSSPEAHAAEYDERERELTAPETPAGLRARLNALAVAACRPPRTHPPTEEEQRAWEEFATVVLDAWPAIDALLARLTAAEAPGTPSARLAWIAAEAEKRGHSPVSARPPELALIEHLEAVEARLTAAEADADRLADVAEHSGSYPWVWSSRFGASVPGERLYRVLRLHDEAIALRRPVKPPYPTDEMLEADAILDAGGELP